MAPPNSVSRPRNTTNSVAIHNSSTSKTKSSRPQPIVRMVHVFAPQRITTDPENFRAIVQKLTGNNDFASIDVDPIMSNKDDVSVRQEPEIAESDGGQTKPPRITATSCASSLNSSSEHCSPPLVSISSDPAFSPDLTMSPSSHRVASPNSTLNSLIPNSLNSASSCTTHSSQYTRSFLYPTYPSPRGISVNEYQLSIDDHDILALPPPFINSNHDPEHLQGSLFSDFDAMMSYMQLPIL